MDYLRFATLASLLTNIPSRRHVLSGLTGLGLALGTSWLPTGTEAKKRTGKKRKGKGKGKGKRPPACRPACTPQECGSDDGCGGTCGCEAGSVCHDGACQACTVTCNGGSEACGDALKSALASGGTVYACPGRYIGNFEVTANQALVGAGAGDNPATSTILDANQNGRVIHIKSGGDATLHELRITGGALTNGSDGGAGIYNQGTLTVTACTVTKNTAVFGAGIFQASAKSLTLNGSTVSDNTATDSGGGINANGSGPIIINGGTISGNRGFNGGGIANIGNTVTVNGGVIKGNRAKNAGAGVFNQGTITFDSASRITGNIADGGGGIYNTFGNTVNLNGATIATNVPDNCAPVDAVPGCSG